MYDLLCGFCNSNTGRLLGFKSGYMAGVSKEYLIVAMSSVSKIWRLR